MGWCVGVRALILNGLVTKPMEWSAQKYKTKIWLRKYGSNMHPALIQLGSTPFFHTHLCHAQLCHTQLFHTQHCLTQLFHAQLSRTHNLSHTTVPDTHTHNIVSHNSSTSTRISFTFTHTHTTRDAAVFCVADVAFGDFDGVFAWHTWHLVTLMPLLCGNRGTWWQSRCFCVAGVALTLLIYV